MLVIIIIIVVVVFVEIREDSNSLIVEVI